MSGGELCRWAKTRYYFIIFKLKYGEICILICIKYRLKCIMIHIVSLIRNEMTGVLPENRSTCWNEPPQIEWQHNQCPLEDHQSMSHPEQGRIQDCTRGSFQITNEPKNTWNLGFGWFASSCDTLCTLHTFKWAGTVLAPPKKPQLCRFHTLSV